jgi:hypothetical protein
MIQTLRFTLRDRKSFHGEHGHSLHPAYIAIFVARSEHEEIVDVISTSVIGIPIAQLEPLRWQSIFELDLVQHPGLVSLITEHFRREEERLNSITSNEVGTEAWEFSNGVASTTPAKR